jgi:hypothetical protein
MRMKRTIHAGIAAAAGALAFTACNADKLTSANNNPNSPVDAPSTALFTNAARSGVGRWEDGVGGTRYAFLAQHLAEVQYPDDDAYTRLKASSTSGLFNSSYSNELEDLEIVRRRGLAANDPATWGPATVLQSWEFGILTDVFGDIPYSQAFKADSGILTPTYDTQQSIYADIFARLTAASAALGGTTANAFGASDPIYKGAPKQWQKFANSLRARHAMRLVNVDPATANTQLTAALSDPSALILTNADNAKLVWPGDGIYDSPWANNFKTRDDHRISTRLLTYLAQWNDPRTPIYAMPAQKDTIEIKDTTKAGVITSVTKNYCPTAGTCYVGLGNALTQAIASPLVPYTSRPGAIFYPGQTSYGLFGGAGKSFPSYLMTAAEVEFIRAEAAERGLGGLNAAQAEGFYNAAITRSMEMWGVDAAAIAAYLAQPGVAYAGTTVEKQKQIAIQKWIALYTDPIQAWSNFRRTCQPAIVRPGPYAVETAIPRRLYYSTTEKAVNAANVAAAVARQGADNFRTRIYWDTKPTAAPTIEAGCGVAPAI